MDCNTLMCLVRGEMPMYAFYVTTEREKTIANFKEDIGKKLNLPNNIKAKDLILWKVNVPTSEKKKFEQLKESSIEAILDGVMIEDAAEEIGEVFNYPFEKKHIHVVVEVPTTSNKKELELEKELRSVKREMDILQSQQKVFTVKASYARKKKTFAWTVNFSNLSLEKLRIYIYKELSFPEEVDQKDLILGFSDDKNKQEQNLVNKESYEQYLKYCIAKNIFDFKINVYTKQKPYSEWSFIMVCDEFKLPVHYKDIPKFTCGIDNLNDSNSKEIVAHLIKDLKFRRLTIRGDSEAYNSKFVLPFLVAASSVCDGKIKIYPEEFIEGKYGRGPVDFCLVLEKIIISVLEVKRDDFIQGVAQIIVQLHSSLETTRKRKRQDDEDLVTDKVYGIVTDSNLWYFFECFMKEDKPEYKIHSEDGTMINWGGKLEEGVNEVLGQIVWIFKEAEKHKKSKKPRQE